MLTKKIVHLTILKWKNYKNNPIQESNQEFAKMDSQSVKVF